MTTLLDRPVTLLFRGHSLGPAVSSELLAAKRSIATRLPLLGAAFCLLQIGGWMLISGPAEASWKMLLQWQALFATALLGPAVTVVVSATVARHITARGGGTWWRPVSAATRSTSLVVVCLLHVGAFLAAAVLPVLVAGWLLIGSWPGPFGAVVALFAVLFCGSLPLIALAFVLSRRFGLAAGVAAGVLWQVLGTARAESATWWAEPWALPVRGALPLLGVHSNGVPLEADSPVFDTPVWAATLVGLAVGAAALFLAVVSTPVVNSRSVTLRRHSQGHTMMWRVGRMSPAIPAVSAALPLIRTAVPTLTLGAGLLLILSQVMWKGSAADQTFGLLVLPAGAGILGVQMWSTTKPAWRRVCTAIGVRRALIALTAPCVALTTLGSVVVGFTVSDTTADLVRICVLGSLLGAAITVSALSISMRFGNATGWIVTAVAVVLGLTFGGSVLAKGPLWIVGPLAWAGSADTWPRITVAVGAAVLWLAAATSAVLDASRWAARRGHGAS